MTATRTPRSIISLCNKRDLMSKLAASPKMHNATVRGGRWGIEISLRYCTQYRHDTGTYRTGGVEIKATLPAAAYGGRSWSYVTRIPAARVTDSAIQRGVDRAWYAAMQEARRREPAAALYRLVEAKLNVGNPEVAADLEQATKHAEGLGHSAFYDEMTPAAAEYWNNWLTTYLAAIVF
jgi:hypothetical protein